jgi:hypothetical protein
MFETGNADMTEGTSDDNPIVLQYIPVDEFEIMLLLLYPPYWYVPFYDFRAHAE